MNNAIDHQTHPIPEIPDEGRSTSATIRERIMAMPEDEEFIITIPIGGDPHAGE